MVPEAAAMVPEAEKVRADRKEVWLTLFNICFFLSAGSFFVLLGLLIPGTSTRFRHQCWQTAAVAFFSAAVITRRHPMVWPPAIRRWYGQRNQKPKPARPVGC